MNLRRASSIASGIAVIVLLGSCQRALHEPIQVRPVVDITINSGGNGSGVVSSSDGRIKCAACTTRYSVLHAVPSVVLTATPSAGSTFVGWGGYCGGSSATCMLSLASNPTVIAYYRSKMNTVAAGGYHTCALLPEGLVSCWGFNNDGEVDATGAAAGSLGLTRAPGVAQAVSLSAGGYHTCALIAGGAIQCWGRDTEGQLGRGSQASVPGTPSTVSGIHDAIAVSAGGFHTCALRATGVVLCWGSNSDGQLGTGTGNTAPEPFPQAVPFPTTAAGAIGTVQVSAGGFHTCTLRVDKSVWCWGRNSEGELGTQSSSSSSGLPTAPVLVGSAFEGNATGSLGATYIAAAIGVGQQGLVQQGGFHTCAIDTTGMSDCWGWNSNGQITTTVGGPFSNLFNDKIFFAVPYPWSDWTVPPPVLKVAAGGFHSCILRTVGIFCWGFNGFGALGTGSFDDDSGPVPGTAGASRGAPSRAGVTTVLAR
jgi:alpha-tubulin suppressor-like RCC1 family protein